MNRIGLIIVNLFFPFLIFSQNPDIDILKKINLNRDRQFDPTFRFISNSVAPLSVASPLVVLTISLIKADSANTLNSLYIGASLITAGIISTSLKYTIKRTRPFITYPYLDKATHADSPSFPSGHTSSAFALSTSLSIAYPKWYFIAPSFLWASSVAYSRMDLGVHYPSDVLAGAIIGAGSAFVCFKLNKLLLDRNSH